MPKLPEVNPDITSESALNMILASIAMEELALSHIINAEGEKLQYIIGTLKCNCDKDPSTSEVLEINKSITELLDVVSHNQMLLKGKMDKAINALSFIHSEQNKNHKCSSVFSNSKSVVWRDCEILNWQKECLNGKCACLDKCGNIILTAKGRYKISFALNVEAECKSEVAIDVGLIKGKKEITIYTYRDCIHAANTFTTLTMSGILIENTEDCPICLSLKLICPNILLLEKSLISIVEI